MYYLERNRAIVKELRKLWVSSGERVSTDSLEATKTLFIPMGSFHSPTLGKEMFVGMKRYPSPSMAFLIQYRAPEEIATIAAIAEHLPDYRDLLPQFYAVLTNVRGEKIGLLMEDFSQGKRLEVYHSLYVPEDIRNLFGRDVLEEDYVENMSFKVEGELKFADFYPFFKTTMREQGLVRFPMKDAMTQVTRTIMQHTIRVSCIK